ncbi:MAG: hypothetical protein ACPG8A_07155 [Psychrobium sp.]
MNRFLFVLCSLIVCSTNASSDKMFDGFDSAHNACYAYSYGYNGVGKDYEKAFKWCGIGHEIEENNSSTTLLAELYFFGYGVDKDLKMALDLYADAAFSGHNHAAAMFYYIVHIEIPEQFNPEQKAFALKMLKLAVESGYDKAKALLDDYESNKTQLESKQLSKKI